MNTLYKGNNNNNNNNNKFKISSRRKTGGSTNRLRIINSYTSFIYENTLEPVLKGFRKKSRRYRLLAVSRPSACPSGTRSSQQTDFHEISKLMILLRFVWIFQFWLNLDKITDTVFESVCICMISRIYDTCCVLYERRTEAEGKVKHLNIRVEHDGLSISPFIISLLLEISIIIDFP